MASYENTGRESEPEINRTISYLILFWTSGPCGKQDNARHILNYTE